MNQAVECPGSGSSWFPCQVGPSACQSALACGRLAGWEPSWLGYARSAYGCSRTGRGWSLRLAQPSIHIYSSDSWILASIGRGRDSEGQ